MAATMQTIYETKAAQTDAFYRRWLTDLNYASLMCVGGPVYSHTSLTPARLRRWFLEGLDVHAALKRANGIR